MLCGSTCPAIETRKCIVFCFSAFQVEHYLASDVSLWDESPCNSKNRQESDYFSIFIVLAPRPNSICVRTLGFRAMIFMHTWLPLFHIQYSQQAVTPPSEYSRLRLSPEKKNK